MSIPIIHPQFLHIRAAVTEPGVDPRKWGDFYFVHSQIQAWALVEEGTGIVILTSGLRYQFDASNGINASDIARELESIFSVREDLGAERQVSTPPTMPPNFKSLS